MTVKKIQNFLKELTDKMHTLKPFSKVVWYDSITSTGDLKWQNELNHLNDCFLKYSDAIFLNYTWSQENLDKSREGHNKVFVGIDVFGRGCKDCHGEGGFKTCKAVKQARNRDLGCAIFAPGWALETLGNDKFEENNDKFWSLLNDDLKKDCFFQLPFYTNFCKGYGNRWYVNGKLEKEAKYFNLSLQSSQPYDYTNLTDEMIYCGSNAFKICSSHDLFDIKLQKNSKTNFILEFVYYGMVELKLYDKNNLDEQKEIMIISSTNEFKDSSNEWKIK